MTPIRVIHVDDEPDFADLTAIHLERERDDFEVVTATSAMEGLEHLAESDIDCIVSDYDMPGMDGLEFLETVREDYPDLPFILFTGRGSEEIASKAITAGVNAYLNKGTGTDQYTVLANRISNAVAQYRAERELEATQARFQSLTQNTTLGVVTIGEDSTVQFANDAVFDLFGYTPEELVGKSLSTVIPDRSETAHFEVIDRYLQTGEKALNWEWIELAARHRDGHEVQVGVSFGKHLADGEHHFTGVIRDITDQKKQRRELQRQRDRLQTIVENAPVVLFALDKEGVFTLFEGQGLEHTNAEPGAIEGESVFDIYAGTPIAENIRQAIDGEAVNSTVEFGGCVFETWYEPIENEANTDHRVIGVAIDITDLKKREEELQRQNERLGEFAGVISHDLRNPLGTAEGYLELARESGDDEHFEKIDRAHGRMDSIIEDVLTLARQGKVVGNTQAVSLPSTVEAAWNTVETDGAELMSGEDLGTIDANDGRLEQLFENLFRNAIEHGGEDVTVRIGRSPAGFYIEDDGPGIPESQRKQVFEHGHTTSESGTGFGLSIVERIADAHGWDVTVGEGADGGARFEIEV
jgi:PAS domain S-box-containing protein